MQQDLRLLKIGSRYREKGHFLAGLKLHGSNKNWHYKVERAS